MELTTIIREGVRGKKERRICLHGVTDQDKIHLKVENQGGAGYLIVTDAYGPQYEQYFGYRSRKEELFWVRLDFVQKYLRFDPIEVNEGTPWQREKFFRLMAIILDVMDGEKKDMEAELNNLEAAALSESAAA